MAGLPYNIHYYHYPAHGADGDKLGFEHEDYIQIKNCVY